MKQLSDKVALITGGARGLGAAHGMVFSRYGANVVLGDILYEEAQQRASEIGPAARAVTLDVAEESSWSSAIDFTMKGFGRLDILVNCAGVCPVRSVLDMTAEVYRQAFEVNQLGTMLGMQAAARVMKIQGGGSIVNIASVDGTRGMRNLSAYCSSKYAIQGLTRSAALEFAPMNIRVNTINPGTMDTPMIREASAALFSQVDVHRKAKSIVPLGRIAAPEEIAEMSWFLGSQAAAYITGASVAVDGGMTAGPLY